MASRMAEAVEPAGLTEGKGAFGGFAYLFGFLIVCLLVYLRSDNIIYLLIRFLTDCLFNYVPT